MRFTRQLTEVELTVLGEDAERIINNVIDDTVRRLTSRNNVLARILSVMSRTQPMTVKQIMQAHNAVHGADPITVEYTRFVVTGMCQSGIVKRKSRGKYLK